MMTVQTALWRQGTFGSLKSTNNLDILWSHITFSFANLYRMISPHIQLLPKEQNQIQGRIIKG